MAKPRLPRSFTGWAILALVLLALAYYVSIPVALLVLAFVSGAPLFTIMLGAAVLGALSLPRGFTVECGGMSENMLPLGLGDQAEVMSTIPLFIFAGYLLAEAGTADRLVRFANAALGWVPGGLAIVTIGTCALFTVFTGASGVTIIALGGVLMPALVRAGYPERFSMGLIAGTGSVGLLFPPALPLFIYGTICGLNVPQEWSKTDPSWSWDTGRFLFSGIVPGLVLIGMLAAVAVTVAVYRKLPRTKFSAAELGKSFLLAIPELGIPFGVIAAIANGFQPSEIAAVTVLYAVVLELGVARLFLRIGVPWGKPLQLRVLWAMSREAMAMIGAIFVIIFCSQVLTGYIVTAKIPDAIVAWTRSHVDSEILFLLAINVILLVVGTVMDIFSAIVVVLPLLLPLAHEYHVDPYHLGVIFLLNLEVGYLHPPVGLNLFITSVKFRRPITEVMWATIPFLVTMIAALLVITYVPSLTAISTPEPPRTAPIHNLTVMIHVAADELTVVKDVALVDYQGNPLKDAKGQPIVRHIDSCANLNENDKPGCQRLFFDVKGCNKDPKCEHDKISAWVVDNNITTVPADQQFALVDTVPLVNSDGSPKTDKAGKPIVIHSSQCGQDESIDEDACHELFLKVSNCKINPDDAEKSSHGDVNRCITIKVSDWVDSNMSSDSP